MKKTLFQNCRFVISQPTPFGGILENGAVYVEGPIIKAVGPSDEIVAQYGAQDGVDVVDAR